MRLTLSTVVATMILSLASGSQAATLFDSELIINGDFETGDFTGWTNNGLAIVPNVPSSGNFNQNLLPAGTLGNFFAVGDSQIVGDSGPASGQNASQRIDVSDVAAQIDAGQVNASYSALLQSFTLDFVTYNLSFLGALDQTLFEFSFLEPISPVPIGAISDGGFTFLDETSPVVPGTRSILVDILMTRPSGRFTDSVVDNVSLTLSASVAGPTPVPLPASLLFLIAGLGFFGFFARGHKIA